jgi:hypothetical protein
VGAQKNRMLLGTQRGKTAFEVSDGNEELTGNWTGGHSCFIEAKNLSIFCPFLKTSQEAKLSDGLINLAEEMLK